MPSRDRPRQKPDPFVGVISNIVHRITVRGIRSVIRSLIEDHIFSFQRRFVFYRSLLADAEEISNEFECRLATHTDLIHLQVFASIYRVPQFKEWLDNGNWIFVAYHGGKPVSFHVVSKESRNRPPFSRFSLKDDQVWIVDIYTLPEYRRHHVAQSLRAFRERTLRSLGYTEAISTVLISNLPTLFHAAKGWNLRVKYFTYVRVLWFHWMDVEEDGSGRLKQCLRNETSKL